MRPLPLSRTVAALLVWVLAMAWSSGTYAEIYKWVDQNGVTNYSSSPPATGKAQTLDPGATMVSVYQAPAPQNAARALDAAMRARIERLEDELRAERRARETRQVSARAESDRRQYAYEQCVRDRHVDCDSGGTHATPYFYAAVAPVVGRPLTPFTTPIRPFTPFRPFTRPAVIGVGLPQPAGVSTRDRLSRKFR